MPLRRKKCFHLDYDTRLNDERGKEGYRLNLIVALPFRAVWPWTIYQTSLPQFPSWGSSQYLSHRVVVSSKWDNIDSMLTTGPGPRLVPLNVSLCYRPALLSFHSSYAQFFLSGCRRAGDPESFISCRPHISLGLAPIWEIIVRLIKHHIPCRVHYLVVSVCFVSFFIFQPWESLPYWHPHHDSDIYEN